MFKNCIEYAKSSQECKKYGAIQLSVYKLA